MPSNEKSCNTHVIAVDGGMIGLADAGILQSLRCRDREKLDRNLMNALHQNAVNGSASVPLKESTEALGIRYYFEIEGERKD